MKTNYEIRYAAHPEDAKGYDTQRIRRDFLMEKVFSDNHAVIHGINHVHLIVRKYFFY